jgi:hypothetical protein
MKFQETCLVSWNFIKIEYKYPLLMNNKKYNTDSKITPKESISDKNKKHDKHPHKLLFHHPATNSDIYAKSETKVG